MHKSENINELAAALAKAQGKIQPAIKDKTNPHFKSRYADLASVWEACRSELSEQGLAVIQTMEARDGVPTLVTTLVHSSGQWLSGEIPILTNKMDPQGIGSAITYYRRYSLSAMVGVAPDDDDDAEAAQNRKEKTKPAKAPVTLDADFKKLTAGLDQDKLNRYIVAVMEHYNYTIEYVKEKAMSDPDTFLNNLNTWDNQQATKTA